MSKRYASNGSSSANKKPKLDVLVNSQTSCHGFKQEIQNRNKSERESDNGALNDQLEDVWGDDLDADVMDDIMLAATQLTQNVPDANVSVLPSFTEFKHPQMSSTQITQCKLINQHPVRLNSDRIALDSSIALNSTIASPSKLNNSVNKRTYDAKKNIPIYCKPTFKSRNFDVVNRRNCNLNDSHRTEELKARLNDVNENRNNQHVNIELEYERLKIDHGKAIDKCLTKEGEVTFLRSQLSSSKAAAESLRIEKLQLNEKFRLELDEQLTLAKKKNDDLMAQLKFKDLEIANALDRMRLLESKKIKLTEPQTQRLTDVASCNLNSPRARTIKIDKRPTETTAVQTTANLKISINDNYCQNIPLLKAIPKEFFEEAENEVLKKDISKYSGQKHHNCLCVGSFLSDVYLLSKLSETELIKQDINDILFKIISITRALALKVTESLKAPSEQLQKRLCKTIKDEVNEENNNIFQGTPWKYEVFSELRKCLAVSSLLILYCPYIRKFVLETNYDNHIDLKFNTWLQTHKDCLLLHHKDKRNLLILLLSIIDSLPETNICLIHEPLLISITEFMISCFKTIYESREILEKILKSIVFFKPSPRVIRRIAELLEYLSLDNLYLEILCVDSKDQISLEFDKGLYEFSKDSCILQIFAVSLETCISKSYIKQDEYLILHNLSSAVINLVRNALTHDLKWTYPQVHCLCSSSIMTSIAVLLHYCVEQYKTRITTFVEDQMFLDSLSSILHGGILTIHKLLMRDPDQLNISLQLSYFGGRFLTIVNFACDMKQKLFKNTKIVEFIEQVLRDLQFYSPLPEKNIKSRGIFEESFSLKFNLTS